MCVWRFESSVWKRLEALLLKALYQMWSQSFLVESHFAQVISSCGMVGEGYCKHSTIFYPTLPLYCWNFDFKVLVGVPLLFVVIFLLDECLVNLCQLYLK